MAVDLVATIVRALRANPALVSAFGESPASPKIWAHRSEGQPAPPYLVVQESGEGRQYTFSGCYVGRGIMPIHLFASGVSSLRTLADLVETALAMPWLVNVPIAGGVLCQLRPADRSYETPDDIGPNLAYIDHIVLSYHYIVGRV